MRKGNKLFTKFKAIKQVINSDRNTQKYQSFSQQLPQNKQENQLELNTPQPQKKLCSASKYNSNTESPQALSNSQPKKNRKQRKQYSKKYDNPIQNYQNEQNINQQFYYKNK
ncbi:hypothetical protein PPERSA_12299 [Pseudocohnilembus persalinus]|uniref:Uncharacterized protein n=1 Tax=Pseudocohnilembus persalinus TaxID=266149 RepID=A0A0V0R4Y2_PSEPJ|nr:hypothetical protein PPERSA_12299 [Pseudocohnilembus persalinus]|eukprot:KRX09556.1 hypothetical protein PPERSA_12299 [Pseudocohnilembus persalinus]